MPKCHIIYIVKRRKQNHKISFHFFAAPPCPPRLLNGLVRKFLVLVRDQREREACTSRFTTNPNAYDLVQNHHALRALQVNQNPADFAHTMFELRPENTANFHFCPKRQNVECRKATPSAIFALRAKVFSGKRKARARARGGSNQSFCSPYSGDVKLFFHFDCPKANFSIQV